jgi:hypothetical protein
MELCGLNMEALRAVEAHNGDVEAQNGALEGLYTSVTDEKQDPDPH